MRISPATIDGVFEIEIESIEDDRGFFARVFCEDEFARAGLANRFSQMSISNNAHQGTLRGMHYSVAPGAETKLVRCTAGRVFDVLVDVRKGSPSFGRTQAFELSAGKHNSIYVPAGVAHGFQTLEDRCEVQYMMDIAYLAAAARGLRWNDPIVSATWPLAVSMCSERDRTYPDFESPS